MRRQWNSRDGAAAAADAEIGLRCDETDRQNSRRLVSYTRRSSLGS